MGGSSIRKPIARTRDRTIPIPAIISAGTRCAARMPGAPVPARGTRNSIAAATTAGTIATDGIQNRPPAADRRPAFSLVGDTHLLNHARIFGELIAGDGTQLLRPPGA